MLAESTFVMIAEITVLRELTRSRPAHTKAYLLPQRILSKKINEKVQDKNGARHKITLFLFLSVKLHST